MVVSPRRLPAMVPGAPRYADQSHRGDLLARAAGRVARMTRVPEGGTLVDRTAQLSFSLDGRPIPALDGDTIGSALAAAGVAITARSFKYHRPRGLYCMT